MILMVLRLGLEDLHLNKLTDGTSTSLDRETQGWKKSLGGYLDSFCWE